MAGRSLAIPLTLCLLFIQSAASNNLHRDDVENPKYWENKFEEAYADELIEQIPQMSQDLDDLFPGNPKDIHPQTRNLDDNSATQKLKLKFQNLMSKQKYAQAQIIAKRLAKMGDNSGLIQLNNLR